MVADKIKTCILNNRDFVLQGGAGCGKTETLKELIHFISNEYSDKKILCITHTNKAVDEIKSRVNDKPVISTIHSFLISLIINYKKNIHQVIDELFKVEPITRLELSCYSDIKEQNKLEHEKYKKTYEKYEKVYFIVFHDTVDKCVGKREYDKSPEQFNCILNDKISELNNKIKLKIEEKGFKSVKYNETRFNNFEEISFGHDGLLDVTALLFDKYPLLGKILNDKFDYIFIDEYQDTNKKTIDVFLKKLPKKNKAVIGLFGDSMQSIYGNGIKNVNDYITSGLLEKIDKEDNFRCSKQVIEFLNVLRCDGLKQNLALKTNESENERQGTVEFFYSVYDNKPTSRSSDTDKETYLNSLNSLVEKSAFDTEFKILLLTNKAVSNQAQFPTLYKVFSDRYGQDPKDRIEKILTKLQLLDLFEICNAYQDKSYNFVISTLKKNGIPIKSLADKEKISLSLQSIIYSNESAMSIVKMAFELKLLKKSESFLEFEHRAKNFLETIKSNLDYMSFEKLYLDGGHTLPKMKLKNQDIDEETFKELESNLKQKQFFESIEKVTFSEVLNYFKYEDEQMQYITMHKTKGTGINNVLVVLDEYFWNQEYDFFSAFNPNEPDLKKKEKNLQLLYVACSRAKFNLRCVRLVSNDEKIFFTDAFKSFNQKEINVS